MSTIIGLVSTFRLPLHWCVGLDFPSLVSAHNIQSVNLVTLFWTFRNPIPPKSPIHRL